MNISVIIPTYQRSTILTKTLESFCGLDTEGITWELFIVDNADDEKTKAICATFDRKLPLQYFVEKKQGKNYAINGVLPQTKGELIVFTDDDIIADPQWLKELWAGSERWPEDHVFGGKIIPHWPDGKEPVKDIREDFFNSSYMQAAWNIEEGPYEAGRVWGPNMAVRRKLFDEGHRFNEDVGPQGENYIMGSETEFTKRMEKMGHRSIYLPQAFVQHQIRNEQVHPRWLYQRAFRYGRADTYHEPQDQVALFLGAPRYLYRRLAELLLKRMAAFLSFNRSKMVNLGIQYWIIRGKIYQFQQGKGHNHAS